jgi:signal-transduction protein with cAMP-binding, CBS, and nucleotidyltransferase domain
MPDKSIPDIMHAVVSIHPEASVEEAVQKMSSQGEDAIFINKMEEYIGIFTKTDLIKLLEKNINPADILVSAVMSKPIFSIDVSASVRDAREMMIEKRLRHYAVSQNGKIVGFLCIMDMD